jgi:isochorismate synthase
MQEERGYIYYHLPDKDKIIYLEGSCKQYIPGDEGFIIVPFEAGEKSLLIFPEIEKEIAIGEALPKAKLPFYFAGIEEGKAASRMEYKTLITACLFEINKGTFQKAVLSRFAEINLGNSFNVEEYFSEIVKAYPSAFTYLLSVPQYGTWLGASPELLLKQENFKIQSMALAGTQLTGQNSSGFTGKEMEEQQFVSDFIKNVLHQYCDDIRQTSSIQNAGEIEHIVSNFIAKLKSDSSGIELAFSLHPTPAVCGSPADRAYDYILGNEKYPRSLYAGFLGLIKKTRLDLYVNLRCMQLKEDNKAFLYAGAGIVKGSEPEKEWMETEKKMDTLRNVFKNLRP